MKVIQNKTYPTMFHAVYPDGTPSADFYNFARAVNHSYVIAENERRDQYRIVSIGPAEGVYRGLNEKDDGG